MQHSFPGLWRWHASVDVAIHIKLLAAAALFAYTRRAAHASRQSASAQCGTLTYYRYGQNSAECATTQASPPIAYLLVNVAAAEVTTVITSLLFYLTPPPMRRAALTLCQLRPALICQKCHYYFGASCSATITAARIDGIELPLGRDMATRAHLPELKRAQCARLTPIAVIAPQGSH